MPLKTSDGELEKPELVDWLSASSKESWFNRFASKPSEEPQETSEAACEVKSESRASGIDLHHFRLFLEATIYNYVARIGNTSSKTSSQLVRSFQRNSAGAGEVMRFSDDEEAQVFKIFDTKCDNFLDLDEFAFLCENWIHRIFHGASALIVVDVQNDFIDGSLALINGPAGEDGADVVPVINRLLAVYNFNAVVYTQDWHPPDHIGFYENLHLRKFKLKPDEQKDDCSEVASSEKSNLASPQNLDSENNPKLSSQSNVNEESSSDKGQTNSAGAVRIRPRKLLTNAKVFDTVFFDEGRMEQKLWPVHCVQNSWGAQLHPELKVLPNSIRVQKGTLPHVDAYSAFWDNLRLNETGLRQELLSRDISDVYLCGLALDYCVASSAMDAARCGFTTFVIEDACKGIDRKSVDDWKRKLENNGVIIIKSDNINSCLLQRVIVDDDCSSSGANASSRGTHVSAGDTDSKSDQRRQDTKKRIVGGNSKISNGTRRIKSPSQNSLYALRLLEENLSIEKQLLMKICLRKAVKLQSSLI